jgi:hypothetical protein
MHIRGATAPHTCATFFWGGGAAQPGTELLPNNPEAATTREQQPDVRLGTVFFVCGHHKNIFAKSPCRKFLPKKIDKKIDVSSLAFSDVPRWELKKLQKTFWKKIVSESF